jgi:hypothetical protein
VGKKSGNTYRLRYASRVDDDLRLTGIGLGVLLGRCRVHVQNSKCIDNYIMEGVVRSYTEVRVPLFKVLESSSEGSNNRARAKVY